MYAEFDAVAVRNPYAWNYGREPKSVGEISTVSAKNRVICTPCKSMSLASLVIVPSAALPIGWLFAAHHLPDRVRDAKAARTLSTYRIEYSADAKNQIRCL